MLVVVWLALIVYTYLDARRRVSDPFLVACATIASFIPYIGTAVYAILRPPEFLEDAHERELEIRAAELRVRQLTELSCPNCEYPVEKNYLRCPNCQHRSRTRARPAPSRSTPAGPSAPTASRPRERSRQRRAPVEGAAAPWRNAASRAAASGGAASAAAEERPAPKRREPRKKLRPRRRRAGHARRRRGGADQLPNDRKEHQP